MRFSSDLLYRWVRSTGRGDGAPASQDLELPEAILPIVSLPGPISKFSGFNSSGVQRESFVASATIAQAASAGAATNRVGTLGRGLWDVSIIGSMVASYTQVFTAAPEVLLQLQDSDGSNTGILRFYAVLNVPQFFAIRFLLLVAEDGWFFFLDHAATGVGETQASNATMIANRLN